MRSFETPLIGLLQTPPTKCWVWLICDDHQQHHHHLSRGTISILKVTVTVVHTVEPDLQVQDFYAFPPSIIARGPCLPQ